MTEGLAVRFHSLFLGLERAHGTYNNIDQTREDGKLTSRNPQTVPKPVTDALWKAHLDGTNGIGIVPIREDSTVVFGAIDVDVYAELNHTTMVAKLKAAGLPLIVCRSKSGGAHIYLFTKVPVPAARLQDRLRDIAAMLGHGSSEIFPKQSQLIAGSNDFGSWINMPYFEGDATNRYAVKEDGTPYSMLEFLEYADACKVDAAFFNVLAQQKEKQEKSKGQKAMPDGPPCLQHLMDLGFPAGTWDTGVFNLGIYCRKAFPVDWRERLVQLNSINFPQPEWPIEDIHRVARSLEKKEYQYTCSKHPLSEHCNKTQCHMRKYGVGSGASSLRMGQLRKLTTAPPTWFLDMETTTGTTVTMELRTEDLQDPRKFQKVCMDHSIVPAMPGAVVWQQTIRTLIENAQEMIAPPEDASQEGQFWELVEEFCTGRAQAHTKDEILLGRPFSEGGRTFFRTKDLISFLTRKQFKDFKVTQLVKVLKMRKAGGKPVCEHNFDNISGKGVNLWSVPEFPKRTDPFSIPSDTEDPGTF